MKATKSKSISSKKSRSKASQKQKATSNSGISRMVAPAAYGVSISRSGPRTFQFTNRELLMSVSSGSVVSTWTPSSWVVNPGRAVFPWLSSIANAFDSYRFHKLKFEYIPKCPTSQSGSVMMSYDYHCTDSAPKSESEMSKTWHTVQGPCYMEMSLSVDITRFHYKTYFTCHDGVPAEETNDVGRFNFALTNGANTNTAQGSLWVDYSLELSEPQQDESLLRMGGEFGIPRIRSLSECVGPRDDPGAWPLDANGNWYYAVPAPGGAIQPLWDNLAYVLIQPTIGMVTLPREWDYCRVDYWVRGLVSQSIPITLATLDSFLKVSWPSETSTSATLANTYCSLCPWVTGATANYATVSYVAKRKTSTTPMTFQPLVSKAALGDYCTKLAVNFFVSRLSETEYDDLIQPGDMP